jgi:hypothetical protein
LETAFFIEPFLTLCTGGFETRLYSTSRVFLRDTAKGLQFVMVAEQERIGTIAKQMSYGQLEVVETLEEDNGNNHPQTESEVQAVVRAGNGTAIVCEIINNAKDEYSQSKLQTSGKKHEPHNPFWPAEIFSDDLDEFFVRLSPVNIHAEDFHGTASIKTAVFSSLLNRMLF